MRLRVAHCHLGLGRLVLPDRPAGAGPRRPGHGYRRCPRSGDGNFGCPRPRRRGRKQNLAGVKRPWNATDGEQWVHRVTAHSNSVVWDV